jgi:hypothetical protein
MVVRLNLLSLSYFSSLLRLTGCHEAFHGRSIVRCFPSQQLPPEKKAKSSFISFWAVFAVCLESVRSVTPTQVRYIDVDRVVEVCGATWSHCVVQEWWDVREDEMEFSREVGKYIPSTSPVPPSRL